MWIHEIRDKTFPFPVPQPNEKLKTGSLTKNRAADEELTDSLICGSKVNFPVFTFPKTAPQSPVRLYSLFRESRIQSEILLRFCAAVTRISSTNNNQRMCREGGRNPNHREALPACLYHICRIRARQGCAAPKGQGLDAP